jgi:hypothetical protein
VGWGLGGVNERDVICMSGVLMKQKLQVVQRGPESRGFQG